MRENVPAISPLPPLYPSGEGEDVPRKKRCYNRLGLNQLRTPKTPSTRPDKRR